MYALNFSLLVGSELRNVWLLSSEVLTVKAVHVCLWKCLCCFIAVLITETEVDPVKTENYWCFDLGGRL